MGFIVQIFMPTRRSQNESFPCPNCGEDVPSGSLSCPECGADEDTGWSDMTEYDGLDLPALDDDDDEPWSEDPAAGGGQTLPPWVILTAILLILVLAGGVIRFVIELLL